MSRVTFLTGWRKRVFDLLLLFRIVVAGVRRLGLRGLVRHFRRYLRDNRNLFSGAADRYVKRGDDVYAAGALPPLASQAFVDYLLEEVQSFNEKRLSPMVMALLSISSRCPYRCPYCYALGELRQEEVVSTDALARALSDLAELEIPTVFLTGGEIMMRRTELPLILAPCRTGGIDVWLVSSGWGMDRESLQELLPYRLRGVVISLDSHHEEQAAKAKGHRDAFRHATAAMRAASELGLVVSVDCIAAPEMVEASEFHAFVEFLTEQGVHFVNFLPVQRTGGAVDHQMSLLDAAQIGQLNTLMTENNRGRKNRHRPIAYSPMVWEAQRSCVAGQQFVYVNPLGEVRPCPFLKEPVGNICDTPLREIIAKVRAGGPRMGCDTIHAVKLAEQSVQQS